MKRVLFVCVENSCRSQMAEAFANRLGAGRVEAHSAGSRPADGVHPRAIAFMAERGYDLSGHAAKSLSTFEGRTIDVVVTMGCGDVCPWVPAARRVDWALSDPKSLPDEEFRAVRDEIERRVRRLLAEWGLQS
jgi:arsenate reductase (thioredoxin)